MFNFLMQLSGFYPCENYKLNIMKTTKKSLAKQGPVNFE